MINTAGSFRKRNRPASWRNFGMRSQINYSEIRVDRAEKLPLYLQLTEELHRLLDTLSSNNRDRLLSIRELSRFLRVNPTTVRKAYDELLRRGVIETAGPRTFRVAKSLKRKLATPFPNIGIVIPYRFSELIHDSRGVPLRYIEGCIDAAAEKNISTIMIQLPEKNASRSEIERFNDLLTQRLLGVIHIGGRGFFPDRPLKAVMENDKLPQAILAAYSNLPNIGSVFWTSEPAAREIAQALRKRGLNKVGFMLRWTTFEPVSPDVYFTYAAYRQPRIVRDCLTADGLLCNERYDCVSCATPPDVFRELRRKKAAGKLPDVYLCYNNQCALWAINALENLGLRVPEDISIIGANALPGQPDEKDLASISLPFHDIGTGTVKRLLDYLENGIRDSNRNLVFPTAFLNGKTLIDTQRNRERIL